MIYEIRFTNVTLSAAEGLDFFNFNFDFNFNF